MIIGIDATNLRSGGGVTHLVELLQAARPGELGIERIVIWANSSTLKAVESKPWLLKRNPNALERSLVHRVLWQRYKLSSDAKKEGCDVLFVPGGSFIGDFFPIVTMSQNLLPFETVELIRFGWSFTSIRLLMLRLVQSRTFRQASGVIFLSQYAQDIVLKVVGNINGQTEIISHGINQRFNKKPKTQREIKSYSEADPYRIIYVSIINNYKHQWHVVEAIASLRGQGLPIVLDLVGPSYPPALRRLNKVIDRVDNSRSWINYCGNISFGELHHQYNNADAGLFASSCENLPIILLENMASGLPIVCSNRGPMPEVLGNTGLYFDPEQPRDIALAVRRLIDSPQLRTDLANSSYKLSSKYVWSNTAQKTLTFLLGVAKQYKKKDEE